MEEKSPRKTKIKATSKQAAQNGVLWVKPLKYGLKEEYCNFRPSVFFCFFNQNLQSSVLMLQQPLFWMPINMTKN